MPPTNRLAHTTIFVADVRRTARFYEDAFGIGPFVIDASGKHAEHAGLVFVQHDLAEVTVPVGYLAASAGAKTLGAMLTIRCADLETTYERALTRGGQKVRAPEDGIAHVRDVNGILIALEATR